MVRGEARWTLPLYEVAVTTARRGWSIGIEDARYWFITPEPVPLAGFGSAARAGVSAKLEPEGITFIGSTFADLPPGVVLLDPQGELIEVDRVVTLSDVEATSNSRSRTKGRSMRFVVVGGAGLIGRQGHDALRQGGAPRRAASPAFGIDAFTGEGLDEAMAGTEHHSPTSAWQS